MTMITPSYLGETIEYSSLHACRSTLEDPTVLWPRRKLVEHVVVEAAAQKGVGIYGMAHCWLRRPTRPGFILGYAGLAELEIREGIRLLGQIL